MSEVDASTRLGVDLALEREAQAFIEDRAARPPTRTVRKPRPMLQSAQQSTCLVLYYA
jgi:hypothetical protein